MGTEDSGTTETAVYRLTREYKTALIAARFTLSPEAMEPRHHELSRLRSTAPKLVGDQISTQKKQTNVQIRGAAAS